MYLWAPFSFKPLQVGPTHLFLFPFFSPRNNKQKVLQIWLWRSTSNWQLILAVLCAWCWLWCHEGHKSKYSYKIFCGLRKPLRAGVWRGLPARNPWEVTEWSSRSESWVVLRDLLLNVEVARNTGYRTRKAAHTEEPAHEQQWAKRQRGSHLSPLTSDMSYTVF